jgi:hypothetical protein
MILAGNLADAAAIKRFHTEAEAAANLQHPNIVAIHEIGEHEGQHYFSMDYVEGKNLAEIANGKPLPATKAATYVKTMAEAIHFAHQRGTLHRDLKPSNVLIDAADQPRITDFGLAKLASRDQSLTMTGAVMGTANYMPPEQASGRQDQVGPHSDVYSLGAILYELLTGKPPFLADNIQATLLKVVQDDPASPRKVNPDVPAELETICLKCLEKSPQRRYATARELAKDLDRFLKNEPILARPASAVRKARSWARQHRGLVTAGLSALILVLIGSVYGLWQQTQYLTWLNGHPGSAKIAGPRTAWLDEYGVLYVFGWLLAALVRGIYSRVSRGVAFRNWLEPRRAYEPLQPIAPGATLAFGVVAVAAVAAALHLTALLIEAKVWEGYAVGSDPLFVYLLFYEGALLLGRLIREQAAATFGVAPPSEPAELTPEQLAQIRDELYAGCRYDAVKLIALYRKFTGVSTREARLQLEQLAARLFREHPEKFALERPPVDAAKVLRVILVLVGSIFLVPFTAFLLPDRWWPAMQGVFVLGLVSGTMVMVAKRSSYKCQLFVAGVIFVITAIPFAIICKSMFYWLAWLLGLLAGFVLVRLAWKEAVGIPVDNKATGG